jgi:hypothetical protein
MESLRLAGVLWDVGYGIWDVVPFSLTFLAFYPPFFFSPSLFLLTLSHVRMSSKKWELWSNQNYTPPSLFANASPALLGNQLVRQVATAH